MRYPPYPAYTRIAEILSGGRAPLSRRGVRKVPMWIRAVLVPDRRGRPVQPNLGDKRPDRALAKRTGHGDAVVPVEHVVGAAASVELDGVHPAAGSDLGCDSLKPRPHVLGSRPEPAVKAPRRVHRADNLADRHHRLTSWSEAADPFILQPPDWSARDRGARYLAQYCQAVAAGWTAEQPAGHLGPVRPPPSTVKIIAGVLLDQSGTHAPDHGKLPSARRRPKPRLSVLMRLCARHRRAPRGERNTSKGPTT